jgi:hypothetical protein
MHCQFLHHTCSSAMRPFAHRFACMSDSCSAYRLIQHNDLMLVFSLALYMRSSRDRITSHIFMIIICGVLCPACLNSSCLSECWLTHCYPDPALGVLPSLDSFGPFPLLRIIYTKTFSHPSPPPPPHSQCNTNTKTKTKYNDNTTVYGTPHMTNKCTSSKLGWRSNSKGPELLRIITTTTKKTNEAMYRFRYIYSDRQVHFISLMIDECSTPYAVRQAAR